MLVINRPRIRYIDTTQKLLALCTNFQKISFSENFIIEHDLMVRSAYYYGLATREIIIGVKENGSIDCKPFIDYLRYSTDFRTLPAECVKNRPSGISM